MTRTYQRSPFADTVAEIQGLYGPFSFPEKLLQKIWLRGDFDRAAGGLADGRRLTVLHPGKWNLLGGPDFRGARLKFGDGPEISGDVELHLHAADWAAHGHAHDGTYDAVILHVVLFPPPPGQRTIGAGGREIPVIALLPLLYHDLEEFAADEAVESLAGRSAQRLPEELFTLTPEVLTARLRSHATDRWRQKVHFARLRLQRLGWDAACHHAALEILGYRFNRSPMLRMATRWPLREWVSGAVSLDEVVASEMGTWQVQGVRPANHPRTRLRQYAAWTRSRADWPKELSAMTETLSENPGGVRRPRPTIVAAATTREVRRTNQFGKLRDEFAKLTGDAIGGTRLDNLICDGFLPLLAARSGDADGVHPIWFHWYPGDLPPRIARGLRQLGVCGPPHSPLAHGPAQGLLGWWIAREARQ